MGLFEDFWKWICDILRLFRRFWHRIRAILRLFWEFWHRIRAIFGVLDLIWKYFEPICWFLGLDLGHIGQNQGVRVLDLGQFWGFLTQIGNNLGLFGGFWTWIWVILGQRICFTFYLQLPMSKFYLNHYLSKATGPSLMYAYLN